MQIENSTVFITGASRRIGLDAMVEWGLEHRKTILNPD
jgi:NAD(P)-dependent dehydrogenase (short-subunit alcohol dehydrogenase family)